MDPWNQKPLPCRRCGRDDRFYEVGLAEYSWSCNVVRDGRELDTEDDGRNIEYFEHRPTRWCCGECESEAASLRDLVCIMSLQVGDRVLLPHGTVDEIELVVDSREADRTFMVAGFEYQRWELDDLPLPSDDQLCFAVA